MVMVFMMMWLLMQVDVNRLGDTALAASPDRVLVVGVMMIGILLIVSLILGIRAVYQLGSRFMQIYSDNRDDALEHQQNIAKSLQRLVDHDESMQVLERRQIDLLELQAAAIDDVHAETKAVGAAVESLKPEFEELKVKLDQLPSDIQAKLTPIVEGVDGLTQLILDTKRSNERQMDEMRQSQEQNLKTLQASVGVIQTSFSAVVAALAAAPPVNGVKVSKEGSV
jgi:uncharacterized protein YoxC